jgi:RND family efflux transporter MFP subunit
VMRYVTLIATAAVLGCSGSSGEDQSPKPVAWVAVSAAETSTIAESATLYGVVEMNPAGERVLSAPVEAVILRIDAPVGTHVSRGQAVAHLAASAVSRLELARASADASAADQAEARAKRLRADGLVGNSEVEAAHAAALGADATRDSLSGRSKGLCLTAPVSGYVTSIAAHPGELVATGGAVAVVAQGGDVRARFGIDPLLTARIHVGANLMIAPAAGGTPIRSPILSVSPVADAQTKLASVFAAVAPESGFNAGVALTATVTLDAAKRAVTIPYAALLDDAGQPFVFVVADGVARRHDVVTGASGADRIAILDGLNAGDRVVIQGGTAVEDGMKVRLK